MLLRDGPFRFCEGGGRGVGTYQNKVLHKKFKRKKIMNKKVPEKKFKHACSLNLYMNRYLKIQEKIDLFNLKSFI